MSAFALLALATALAARPAFEPVPLPPLAPLEPAVAAQIAGLHREVTAALERPGVPDADLMEAFGLLGEHLHAYDLFEGAAAAYRDALLLATRDYRWLHLLADVTRRRGDDAEAIGWHERALAARPGDVTSLVSLGELLVETGRPVEAEKAFREALSRDPSSAAAHAGLGSAARARGAWAEAAEQLEAALRLVPEAGRLHYELGMAYRGLGRLDEARAQLALRSTVGVRAADPLVDGLRALVRGEKARVVRGRLLYANGRFAEAAEEFAAAVAAAPESAANQVALGSALASMGRDDAAESRFRRALALEPTNETARYDLVLLLSRQGKDADDVILESASALEKLERFREERDLLEEAHRESPTSGRIARALAALLAACPDPTLRDGARAWELAKRIHAAAPTPAHARLLALARAECGAACAP